MIKTKQLTDAEVYEKFFDYCNPTKVKNEIVPSKVKDGYVYHDLRWTCSIGDISETTTASSPVSAMRKVLDRIKKEDK